MNLLSPNAQAIVIAHQAALALPVTASATAKFSNTDPVYRDVLQACLALGFIEIDAECVALAWAAQTRRTGRFDPQAWPVEPVDFGLQLRGGAKAFPACPQPLGLYAVLPDAQWVGRMARAGVPTVQLRFKSQDKAAIEQEVKAAVDAVRGTKSLLFINDHWQAAVEAGAYGVHLGQEDMEDAPLERIRCAGLRLGLSSHGYFEMLRAARMQPSYLALGAVYPTTLKRMATAAQGPGRLSAYARLMHDYPLVAIGGIDESRMSEVLASGVGSVAVVRAITAQPDPESAASRMMQILGNVPIGV
jgi:thiamine-phosphate pyrophosphorylase